MAKLGTEERVTSFVDIAIGLLMVTSALIAPNVSAQELDNGDSIRLLEPQLGTPKAGLGAEGVWRTYRYVDGLADNTVSAIIQDEQRAIWFATDSGVSRFDGKNWETYTKEDGLGSNYVLSIMEDKQGVLWFGTDGGGISQFDGKNWETYTREDGLAGNHARSIMEDKEGVLWFGTDGGGVSQFDGKNWKTYTQLENIHREVRDVVDNPVSAIVEDKEGALWFGTGGGVRQYNGKNWKTYKERNGLAHNRVNAVIQDKEGMLWFGTDRGGVNRFDGKCFQTLDSRDGLANDSVNCLYMDRSGQIWIGTGGGAVRFMPNKIRPPVYVTQVLADEHTYPGLSEGLKLPADVTRVAFGFHAISFKTRPGGTLYYYQLVGHDSNWRGPTSEELVEYFNLRQGEYNFKVQAVDRDLNYSKPSSVSIAIPATPFYQTSVFLIVLSVIGGGSLLGVATLAAQRRRASRAYKMAEQVQAAKMLSLRQLVAGVAHQMNNPIGTIASNNDVSSRAIEKIKERIDERGSQEIKEDRQLTRAFAVLDKMNEVNRDASWGVARTVADLRSFVKLDEAEWQLADIHEAMDHVLGLMESEFSNRIRVIRDYGDIPRIYCSPSGLNQVFMSMFRNACEAIDGGRGNAPENLCPARERHS